MQLVSLLLPVLLLVAVQALSFEERREALKNKLQAVKDRLKARIGNATEQTKRKMARGMDGIDPEARKSRLERLQRKANKLEEKIDLKLKESLAKIQPVETERINEDEPVSLYEVNAMQGVDSYMFQSDMHLTDEQLDQFDEEEGDKRVKRSASSTARKWTDNTLNFYFDAAVSERKRKSVRAAHAFIQSRSCVKFVETSTATNKVKVINGAGCYSSVGMRGGEQTLSLGDGCEVIGTSAHEFAHALGFWHMQMRSDRDEYLTVDLSAVRSDMAYNFDKLKPSENSLTTPYEYGSSMQYSANSFAVQSNKIAMIPKDTRFTYTMGNDQVSFYDIVMINNHYGCNTKCNPVNSQICKNGGIPNPNDCKVCVCPLGYAGVTCEERPSGCGSTLTATTTWKSQAIKVGDITNLDGTRDDFMYCNYWIQAPTGYEIVTRITSMKNSFCQYGCPFSGVEMKGDVDQKMTNPRFCCAEFRNQNVTSVLNPTPVIAYNRYYLSDYTLEYTAVPSKNTPTVAVPPTTTPTTTTTKTVLPNKNCKSAMSKSGCEMNKALGFCQIPNPSYTYQIIKYNCAVECGLCGKAAPMCADDVNTNCVSLKNAGLCQTMDPMVAEYFCAKTCGYCTNPN